MAHKIRNSAVNPGHHEAKLDKWVGPQKTNQNAAQDRRQGKNGDD